jgi:undecaprenyl phosphate-alpha-L-ara4FN deformylase
VIGKALPHIVRMPHQGGHEVGLHAWDHYTWQAKIDTMNDAQLTKHVSLGFDTLAEINGVAPSCSAAAGWRCHDRALLVKETFGFRYNGDCRGVSVFRPQVGAKLLAPQVPVTLPTYDEIIGANGINHENYNEAILNLCKPDQLNVYTIHAEAEGINQLAMFEKLLDMAKQRDIRFIPLGHLPQLQAAIPASRIICETTSGREGWVATQAFAA